MRRLAHPLLVLLAIVFLIEAWLWSRLEPLVEWIVERLPLRTLKRSIASLIRKLPPAATLIVFIVPIATLFPLKLLGFWLLAQKQWLAASVMLLLAKLVGLAVTAFVFEVTRPKLLKLGWFRWLYDHVLFALDWAHRLVAPIQRRIKKVMRMLRSKRAGHALRMFWHLRRHLQAMRRDAARSLRTNARRAVRTAQSS